MAAIEGDWLVALRQDAGRGRHSRKWEGLDGNFFGSTVIQLRPDDPPAPALAQDLYLLAIAGFLGSVVGAFYYIKIVKVMYFDAPGRALAKGGNRLEGLLILLAALLVSPLTYPLVDWLNGQTLNAAGSLF